MALFDGRGRLVAQTGHISVHVGALPAGSSPISYRTALWPIGFRPRAGQSAVLAPKTRGGKAVRPIDSRDMTR